MAGTCPGGGVPNPDVCTHTLYSAVYAATAHIHVSYKCIRMSHTYAFSRPPRRCGAFSEFSVLRGNTPVLPCACWGVCRKVEDGQGRSGLDYAEAADHKAIIALLNTGR